MDEYQGARLVEPAAPALPDHIRRLTETRDASDHAAAIWFRQVYGSAGVYRRQRAKPKRPRVIAVPGPSEREAEDVEAEVA